jgi:hypothetical protein
MKCRLAAAHIIHRGHERSATLRPYSANDLDALSRYLAAMVRIGVATLSS